MAPSFAPAAAGPAAARSPDAVPPVFELEGAVVRYGGFEALSGIGLRVAQGERVALAGPSGAGKTTLLRLLNGSLSPDEGTVRAFGRDLSRLPRGELRKLQRRIGAVHQPFHLVDALRVVHNVNAGRLGIWPLWKAALSLVRPLQVEAAAEMLAAVGIGDKLYERTDRLSGGEQQRVALIRALVQEPAAVLADEPISSLDRENSRRVMELLRRLSEEEGKTVVASMHDIRFALRYFERIVGIREGRVLFDLPAGRVDEARVETLYAIERRGWKGGEPPGGR